MKFSRLFRWFVGLTLVLAAGFAVVSTVVVWSVTHPAHLAVDPVPVDFPFPVENVRFPAGDGVGLAGWFLPCPGATRAAILLHGNGRSRRGLLSRARFVREQGYAVLLYDARGHGESGDALVSFGWYETRDLLGAQDFLLGRGFTEFGLLGMSQGAATIALAAPRLRDVKWAVLEAPYSTLRKALDGDTRLAVNLPGWFAGALFPPLLKWRLGLEIDQVSPRDTIAALHCPVLIMVGGADPRARPPDVREIFDRANQPKAFWIVPYLGHTSLYDRAKPDYEQRFLRLLDTAH
jgi:pimeloyl-ACP methyl ester carboxylesterase